MRDAGFTDLQLMRAGRWSNPIFADADGHPRLVGDEPNALEAFAIEARVQATG